MKTTLLLTLLALRLHADTATTPDAFNPATLYPGAIYEYDKFRDYCSLDSPDVLIAADPKVYIKFFTLNSGKVPHTPAVVTGLVDAHSQDWQWADDHEVIILADDSRIHGFGPEQNGKVLDDGSVAEQVTFAVSVEDIKKMLAAKDLEIAVGAVTHYSLNGPNVDDLRSYFKTILTLISAPAPNSTAPNSTTPAPAPR